MIRVIKRMTLMLSVIALVFVALCACLYFAQESLVFFPDRHIHRTPSDLGLSYEDVQLDVGDGVRIDAWWIPAERPRGALLLLNGNAGNRGDRLDKVSLLLRYGLSVLSPDYRGYGTSSGKPTEDGTYLDAGAALGYIEKVRGYGPEKIILYGESLGGAIAIKTAAGGGCVGLVVESSFTSVGDMAKKYYPWLPFGLIGKIRYDSAERVRSVRCPKLFLHSPTDEIVPYYMGRALYEAAPPPKSFCDLQGGHNGGGIIESPEAQRALGAFIDTVLSPGS